MWVGTADSLVRIQNGVLRGFTTADGMAGNWVSSIYDDKRGSIWFSSPRGGLTRYREGRFTVYNSRAGLFNDAIFCVLGDGAGNLWMSSPRGIGRISRKDLDGFADGVRGNPRLRQRRRRKDRRMFRRLADKRNTGTRRANLVCDEEGGDNDRP